MASWCGREALRRTRSATLDPLPSARAPSSRWRRSLMTVVGRVAALRRYPVKSMAAEELDGAEVSWHGLAGDRRWAFIRAGQVRSGFPWLTIRERPELAHYRPRFAEPGRPNASPVLVRTPCGGNPLECARPASTCAVPRRPRGLALDAVLQAVPVQKISAAPALSPPGPVPVQAGRGRPPIAHNAVLRVLRGQLRTNHAISETETTAPASRLSGRSLPGPGWSMQELAWFTGQGTAPAVTRQGPP